MLRREFLRRGAAVLVGAPLLNATACAASARAQRARPLRLRPPRLNAPTTLDLSAASLEGVRDVQLRGPGRDWIIRLPRDAAIERGVTIDGMGEARNVVLIGGEIRPRRRLRSASDPLVLEDGSWSVYARRGFSGATGGTFELTLYYRGPKTSPLPWNATPDQIRAALEQVAGTGSIRAVEGTGAPGGPWTIVPADDRVGRVELDLDGLEGNVRQTTHVNEYGPFSYGLVVKNWRGTMHLEGLQVGGPWCDEVMNVSNPYAGAVLQMASVRLDGGRFDFNGDWHHPDALQCYLGPATLRMERCDLISRGAQVMMGQPRTVTSPLALQELRDWWFDDVVFECRASHAHDGRPGAGVYQEDDWPHNNNNDAGWRWRMRRCFVTRRDLADREFRGQDLLYFNHYPHAPPAGLTLGGRPRHRARISAGHRTCGLRYRSPGYAGRPVSLLPVRLRAETRVA